MGGADPLVMMRTVPVGMRIRKALGRAAVRQARQQGDKGEPKSTRHVHSAKPCMRDFCRTRGRNAFNFSMRHGQLTGGDAGKSNPSRSADLARPATPIAMYVRPVFAHSDGRSRRCSLKRPMAFRA